MGQPRSKKRDYKLRDDDLLLQLPAYAAALLFQDHRGLETFHGLSHSASASEEAELAKSSSSQQSYGFDDVVLPHQIVKSQANGIG